MSIDARDRLIVALDVPSSSEAEALIMRLGEAVRIVKIGLELFIAEGPEVVRRARRLGKEVFLDLKFLDIDETVRRATASAAGLDVSFLTVHATRKAIGAAVQGRAAGPQHPGLKLLAVTVLTNVGSEDLADSGITMPLPDLVLARARVAAELGCDGVVASGREPAMIRQALGDRLLIVTPGIRPAQSSTDDHARASTPEQAILAGADYLVVGRPIRDAHDPRQAAEQIIGDMQRAFDCRAAVSR
jgi:orotidine-5'-phosphate decarboxylase